MRDGPLRRTLKLVARLSYALNLAVYRAVLRARGEERFRLGGQCGGCAQCCEEPGIQVGRITWFFPTARRVFLWWQRHVNGFELVGREVPARVLYFRCTHFDVVTRRCDSYDSRPGMCRDYPRGLLYQTHPELMPGCGYRAIDVNAPRLLRVLQDEPMTDAQREQLKKSLFLE